MFKTFSDKCYSFLVRKNNVKFVINRCLNGSGVPYYSESVSFKWKEPCGYDTGVSIYNSFLKGKVKLMSRQPGILSWYCCGPTVYDSAHIGHGCCYVTLDIIRRILRDFCGINVIFVMGMTDIDDKIIARGKELGECFTKVSRKYEKEFLEDMSFLNVIPPTKTARVTDNLSHIVQFIQSLIDKGFGYPSSDGSVYFSVEKLGNLYGKFDGVQDSIQDGSGEGKRNAVDFALWKGAKDGDPSWEAPWGMGRPGWHIECSTIASWIFGEQLDIHSGGIDLRFPHHENEEAQSCAKHSISQWVNYWIHTGHLSLKGNVKMSKSLKNSITIRDFLKQYHSNHLRMLCLLSPYRNGIYYGDDVMKKAVAECEKFDNFLAECDAFLNHGGDINSGFDGVKLMEEVAETGKNIFEALIDDFDTPRAISHLSHLVNTTNAMLHSRGQVTSGRALFSVAAASDLVQNVLGKLGIICQRKGSDMARSDFDTVIDTIVQFRTRVRERALGIPKEYQNFDVLKKDLLEACDTFRKSMMENKIEIKDSGKSTSSWRYKR